MKWSVGLVAIDNSGKDPIVVVSGPTASGKSDLAIQLAKHLNGEVINIDSVQVFRHLDIGSAKVSFEQRSVVPHHLIDIRNPDQSFNAGEFLEETHSVIADLQTRKKQAVFAGGTTMYLTALLHGLAELPDADPILRQKLQALSTEELYSQLREKDSEAAAKLHPNDRMRVSRALETIELSGKSLSEVHAAHDFKSQAYRALVLVVCRPRGLLYSRINQRTEKMLEQGLIEETQKVVKEFGACPHSLRTLGYSEVLQYLSGELPREQLVPTIAMNTRRFAKRQMTYWRNEPRKRGWLCIPEQPVQAPVEVGEKAEVSPGFETLNLSGEDLAEKVRQRLLQPFERTEVWYVNSTEI